ncbi:D-alanyl-D-alanine dipeptidase [Streptomyces sp. VMFN-G11Ma]|nr:D-alanyl-D-alanine dipeptidase [Streptomyces sp. VMFN-G11Ma]
MDRLLVAQSRLPDGLRLLFVEGYRTPALQRHYFERYADELRAAHPQWPAERVRTAASRYVSPPEIAPHSAGAAVDLTLADADGRELDLGTPMNTERWHWSYGDRYWALMRGTEAAVYGPKEPGNS